MEYINLSSLPKTLIRGRTCIDWKNTIGMKVSFVYDDIEGMIEILEYTKNQYIKIKYKNDEKSMSVNNFKNCKFGKLLNKINRGDFVYCVGDIVKDDNKDITIIDMIRKPSSTSYNAKYIRYRCNICGYESDFIYESKVTLNICGCRRCAGKGTFEGYNDIATLSRWMIPYFQNGEEEARKYTPQSRKRVIFKCPDCGNLKDKPMVVADLYRRHSIGCTCKDNKSFPEKLFNQVLSQMNIDYQWGFTVDWLKGYKGSKYSAIFDFYIPSYSVFIEIDGNLGHGKKVHSKSMDTIEDTKIKDDWKDEQARLHGFSVIRIQADKSEIDYLKTNIIKALEDKFDLSNIDWKLCNEKALKSIIKEVCEYFESHKPIGTIEISRIFKLDKTTVRKYLIKGSEVGWCTYSVEESIANREKNRLSAIINKQKL